MHFGHPKIPFYPFQDQGSLVLIQGRDRSSGEVLDRRGSFPHPRSDFSSYWRLHLCAILTRIIPYTSEELSPAYHSG